MTRENVVVFGGSGFVGSHVCDALSEAGYNVTIYDLTPSPYLRPDQKMVKADILDTQAVTSAIAGADYVFHFAGIADLDHAGTAPQDTVNLNILGTVNILNACVHARVKRFIFASSIYVYSQRGGFYRCSKQAAEAYIEEYKNKFDLDFSILRYGTLFGPRADNRNSIYRYLSSALKTGHIATKGSGDERREYIYVVDAAKLTSKILEEGYANQRITITGHQSIYFRDLLNMISEMLGGKVEVEYSGETPESHYYQTPYSYLPKPGLKITSNPFTDLGQGLLDCLAEIDQSNQ